MVQRFLQANFKSGPAWQKRSISLIFEPKHEFLINLLLIFCSFERELKNKLSEKTRGAQSEEQVLMKAFKYFDLNDNGTVEPDEFAKAIEKIGI